MSIYICFTGFPLNSGAAPEGESFGCHRDCRVRTVPGKDAEKQDAQNRKRFFTSFGEHPAAVSVDSGQIPDRTGLYPVAGFSYGRFG